MQAISSTRLWKLVDKKKTCSKFSSFKKHLGLEGQNPLECKGDWAYFHIDTCSVFETSSDMAQFMQFEKLL